MPQIITPDNKEHWLKLRAEDITSTDVSALFTDPVTGSSLSPYSTEYELYHIKTGLAEDSFEETDRMKWGKRLEVSIAEGIAEDLGIEIIPFKHYLRHSEEPHMGSSFDFCIVNHERGDGNLEIKNVDGLIYRNKWTEGEATDYIELQVQHQMEVADVEWTLICALVGGNEPKFIYRERDRAIGKGLCKAVREFWAKVEAKTPPEPNYLRDSDFIVGMHQKAGGEVLESEDEMLELALRQYKDSCVLEKEHIHEKKVLKAQIFDIIGNDYSKVKAGAYTLHCGMTKDTEPTVITKDMIGQTYGGRKGYRTFKLYEKEA